MTETNDMARPAMHSDGRSAAHTATCRAKDIATIAAWIVGAQAFIAEVDAAQEIEDDREALKKLRGVLPMSGWTSAEAFALAGLLQEAEQHADAAGDWLIGDEE